MDGITHSTIARNLALSQGSFWDLHYSDTFFNGFFGHPPLGFYLQSLTYQLWGDYFWVDKIYSIFTAFLSAFLIYSLWTVSNSTRSSSLSWMIILLWITCPIIFWSYSNNLLENTITIFTLSAVVFYFKSFFIHRFYFILAGSTCIFLAVLTKGPIGFFPFFTFAAFYLSYPGIQFRRVIFSTIFSIFSVAFLIIALILFDQNSLIFLREYVNVQILSSLFDDDQFTTSNRFYIIIELLEELLIPTLLIILVCSFRKFKMYRSQFIFFLLMGISASFPFIISLKQREFYLVPSIPFFILAIASILIPTLMDSFKDLGILDKYYKGLWLLFYGSIIISITTFGQIGRDHKLLNDIHYLTHVLDENYVVKSYNNSFCSHWKLIAYLARNRISIDCTNKSQSNWMIVPKEQNPDIEVEAIFYLNNFDLYKIKLNECRNSD